MADDPWKHRSAGMKCKTCMWFAAKESPAKDDRGVLGRCRRHAPSMNGFVPVFEMDWCGDHRLDESKIARRLTSYFKERDDEDVDDA